MTQCISAETLGIKPAMGSDGPVLCKATVVSCGGTCEDEEGGAVRDDSALVVEHAVSDSSHAVLSYSKPEIPF